MAFHTSKHLIKLCSTIGYRNNLLDLHKTGSQLLRHKSYISQPCRQFLLNTGMSVPWTVSQPCRQSLLNPGPRLNNSNNTWLFKKFCSTTTNNETINTAGPETPPTASIPNVDGFDIKNIHSLFHFHHTSNDQTKQEVGENFIVIQDFINYDEEQKLMDEVEPHLQRMRYEFDHWDNAIVGFRETEVGRWSEESQQILDRIRTQAFTQPGQRLLVHTHILDLAADGHIKPHVDSVRFCGDTISGVSLNSNAVMRLVKEKSPDQIVDILLPRRSLYIMRNSARYDYTHEVLASDVSKLGTVAVPKNRRISIICRNEP